jgi:hypothetical protein
MQAKNQSNEAIKQRRKQAEQNGVQTFIQKEQTNTQNEQKTIATFQQEQLDCDDTMQKTVENIIPYSNSTYFRSADRKETLRNSPVAIR